MLFDQTFALLIVSGFKADTRKKFVKRVNFVDVQKGLISRERPHQDQWSVFKLRKCVAFPVSRICAYVYTAILFSLCSYDLFYFA